MGAETAPITSKCAPANAETQLVGVGAKNAGSKGVHT